MNNLKETKISSEIVFKGKLLDVRKDKVTLPNGGIGTREWINHPGAACCIPVLPNGKIGLISQYRYPLGKQVLELPAGKLDDGETPEDCAKRELEEEIGFQPQDLDLLTCIYPAIGFANEKIWIYLAQNLKKTKTKLSQDEFLILHPLAIDEAIKSVKSGVICDAKTVVGLLWVDRFLGS